MKNNDNNFGWTGTIIQKCLDNKDYLKLDIKDKNGDTGFIKACIEHPELAEIMLEREDINFNIQNKWGDTGFMWACKIRPELLKIMLNNKKVDKNLKNKDGLTGYDIAKEENQESFERYQAWLTKQEKNNINNQVQKRTKKTSQHL